jgi:YidC/Oxa1 family membrane protein insertase
MYILKQILEFWHSLTGNYGLAIILLSLSVTIIMLPLFWIAEIIQNKERLRKAQMQPALDKLKDVTNKKEKYFYTKRIYKQYHYSPIYALSGLIGLAIQVPFFIAAYRLLLDYAPLNGITFGPITDLSQPDNIFEIGRIPVNTLAILMTMVNLLGIGLQYKYMNRNEAKQLVFIAFVFLVLLYNLPAALLLYWTINNVFAIGKNWLFKILFKQWYQNTLPEKEKMSTLLFATINKVDIRNVVLPMSIIAIYFFIISTIKNKILGMNVSTLYGYYLVMLIGGTLVLITVFYLLRLNAKHNVRKVLVLLIINVTYLPSLFIMTYRNRDTNLILLTFMLILILMYTINKVFNNKIIIDKEYKTINVELKDLALSWIFLLPLINYHITNPEYFSISSAILYYVVLFMVPLIANGIIIYSRISNRKLIIVTIISIILTTYLMPAVSNYFKATAEANILVHIVTIIVVYSIIKSYSYGNKSVAFVFVSIGIIVMSLQQFPIFDVSQARRHQEKTDYGHEINNTSLYDYLLESEMKYKPDIYLLVYDAYVSSKLMKYYNINNYATLEYLQKSGFTVYNNTYSAYADSRGSMAGVLDMGQNIEITRSKMNELISGNSNVDNILQNNGYNTNYVLASYFLRGNHNFGGDYAFPNKHKIISSMGYLKTIIQCILLGEFVWDFEFNNEDQKTWEQEQTAILRLQLDRPKFLYSHSKYPGHSSNSGKVLQRDFDRYRTGVKTANTKIIDDVNSILLNKKDAIIIIASDHGPYLTGDGAGLTGYKETEISGLHIADRYGVFLAVKYPDKINQATQKDNIFLQNIFLEIFSDLYDDDEIMNFKTPPTTKRSDGFIAKGPLPDAVINNGHIMFGKDKGKTLAEILDDLSP